MLLQSPMGCDELAYKLMDSSSEATTIRFLSELSSLYKDSLPVLSRHLNLDFELILDSPSYTQSRCKTHCPHCYVSFVPGINCSVRSRSSKQLKALQRSLRIQSVSGYGNKHIVFGKRTRTYWTIRCRKCNVIFVDFSQRLALKSSRRRKGKFRGKFSKLTLGDKFKTKVSRKKRAKNAKIEKTKKKLLEKQNLQSLMPKPKTLKDFLIDCDVKLD